MCSLGCSRSGELSVVLRTFLFSSRRRHTRSLCDWSSDVCSSDLIDPGTGTVVHAASPLKTMLGSTVDAPGSMRSEERRVGKERSARVWREHERKKGSIRLAERSGE